MYDGYHHLHLVVGVSTFTVEQRASVSRLAADELDQFLALLGVDGELDVLLAGVNHHIDGKRIDYQRHVAIDHHLPVVEDEVATADDHEVQVEQHTSDADVLVLVDDGSNDVPSACASTAQEHHADTDSVQHGTQDAGYSHVIARAQDTRREGGVHGHDSLSQVQVEGQGQDGIERLERKLAAQLPPCQQEQDGVDHEQGILHGKSRGILDDGRYTGSTTRGDVVGQHEDGPSQAVHCHTQVDEHHVLDEVKDLVEGNL